MSKYVATQFVYDPGVAEMGTHSSVIVKAPTQEAGVELTELLMKAGSPPFWPEYADNVQFDSGSIEFASDIGEHGFYYTIIEDMDVSQEVYDEAIEEGNSEEEAQERAYEEAKAVVGVEPLEQRTFNSRQAALDWLQSDGLYPPHRVHEVEYPWESNPASNPAPSTKSLKNKLLR